ncbi:MAG: sugar ABC transporter permease [Chloroflexota bacterium]|nr:sugar ABC transporter permease [Chloroflexota bacterium]
MPAPRAGILNGLWRRHGTAAFFMLPALAVIVILFVAPALITLGLAFTDTATATGLSRWEWIGFANFEQLLRSSFTGIILRNTAFYVATTLALNLGLGLGLALLSVHVREGPGRFFRALWLLPRITPSVVYALMWVWASASPPFGIINQLVAPLGVESRAWLSTDPWLIVIAINGFVGASFGMIVFTSAIQSIPEDLFRAARVDGANAWQIVRRISLPLLRWPILFVFVYQAMSLLASYEYILLTTDGGPGLYGTEVWSLWAFHTALNSYSGNLQFGLGAAMATVLVVIGIIVSASLLRLFHFGSLVTEPRVEIN